MTDKELEKWIKLSLNEVNKMNMISQMEYRAKEHQLNQERHNHSQSLSRHILYAALISGGIIASGAIIAVIIGIYFGK